MNAINPTTVTRDNIMGLIREAQLTSQLPLELRYLDLLTQEDYDACMDWQRALRRGIEAPAPVVQHPLRWAHHSMIMDDMPVPDYDEAMADVHIPSYEEATNLPPPYDPHESLYSLPLPEKC